MTKNLKLNYLGNLPVQFYHNGDQPTLIIDLSSKLLFYLKKIEEKYQSSPKTQKFKE